MAEFDLPGVILFGPQAPGTRILLDAADYDEPARIGPTALRLDDPFDAGYLAIYNLDIESNPHALDTPWQPFIQGLPMEWDHNLHFELPLLDVDDGGGVIAPSSFELVAFQTFELPLLDDDEPPAGMFAPRFTLEPLAFFLPLLHDLDGGFVSVFDHGVVAPGSYAFPFGIRTVPARVDDEPPAYVAKIVRAPAWSVVATIPALAVDSVVWELNSSDAAGFRFPKRALPPGILRSLGDHSSPLEVQLFLDGDLIAWGPVVDLSGGGSAGEVHVELAGCDFALHRRNIDSPRKNRLLGADFEDGDLSYWGQVGLEDEDTDDLWELTDDDHVTGQKCLRLINDPSLTERPQDAFVSQSHFQGPNGVGLYLLVSAWLKVIRFDRPAYENRGLYVETRTEAGDFVTKSFAPITKQTPRGQWIKMTTAIRLPPNTRQLVNVRLYAPGGEVLWDEPKLLAMDSLSTPGHFEDGRLVSPPLDVGKIIGMIVASVQSPANGKSDLRIGTQNAVVGRSQARSYQFADHVGFDSALGEFVERDDGVDWAIELTTHTRTFRTWAGKRGVNRYGSVHLNFVAGGTANNCADFDIAQPGADVFTRSTVMNDDDGLDRELGEYLDASPIGGLILEELHQAPQGSKLDSLDRIAIERVGRNNRVPNLVTFTVLPEPALDLVHVLKPGDVIHGTAIDGFWHVDEAMRVQRIELLGNGAGDKANTLRVTAVTKDPL